MSVLVGVPGSNFDLWILLLHRSSVPILVGSPLLEMADAAQPPRRGERRAAARAHNEEEGRRVRQRLDDVEVRLDGMQSRIDMHEMRLGFVEAHIKVVLRGFDAVPEFFRSRDGDFRLAKSAFIAAFMAELKENTGAEANASLAEAETLICDDNGLVVVGVFPTGGHLGQCPDAILRLQPTWAGSRLSYLLVLAAKFLVETRQIFTDRVRKPKGKGKGKEKGAGKGNPQEPGRKGKKGHGKGKAPDARPKMAAGPA